MHDRFKPRTGIERRRTCVVSHVIVTHQCVAQKSTMYQRRGRCGCRALKKTLEGSIPSIRHCTCMQQLVHSCVKTRTSSEQDRALVLRWNAQEKQPSETPRLVHLHRVASAGCIRCRWPRTKNACSSYLQEVRFEDQMVDLVLARTAIHLQGHGFVSELRRGLEQPWSQSRSFVQVNKLLFHRWHLSI